MTLSVEVEKLETRHATFYRHTLINYNVFLSNSIVKRVIDSVKYLKLQLVTVHLNLQTQLASKGFRNSETIRWRFHNSKECRYGYGCHFSLRYPRVRLQTYGPSLLKIHQNRYF